MGFMGRVTTRSFFLVSSALVMRQVYSTAQVLMLEVTSAVTNTLVSSVQVRRVDNESRVMDNKKFGTVFVQFLIQVVLMVQSDWLMETLPTREGSSSVIMVAGVLLMGKHGQHEKQLLCCSVQRLRCSPRRSCQESY